MKIVCNTQQTQSVTRYCELTQPFTDVVGSVKMLANNTEEYMHRHPNDLNITAFLFSRLNRDKRS